MMTLLSLWEEIKKRIIHWQKGRAVKRYWAIKRKKRRF